MLFRSGQSSGNIKDLSYIFQAWRDTLFRPLKNQRKSSASILGTTGIKDFDDYQALHEARESGDGLDTEAFREYTKVLRTLDLKQPTNLDALVFNQRNAILKEKIDGFSGESGAFSILVWVDQIFLPESDSLTLPVSAEEGLEKPLPVVVETPPLTETIKLPSTGLDSLIFNKSITIPAVVGKVVTIENILNVPLTIQFSLPNRGVVSQLFELSDSLRTSSGKLRPIPLLPNIVVSRDSVSRAVEKIDQQDEIAPNSTKNFLIFTKTGNAEDLIISLSRSQLSPELAPFSPSGGGGGGCFIATAAFGSPNHQAVLSFCKWRDETLLKTKLGRDFVSFYYKNSPPIASFLERNPTLRVFALGALTLLLWMVKGSWLKLLTFFALLVCLAGGLIYILKSLRGSLKSQR